MVRFRYSKIWYGVLFLLLANIASFAATPKLNPRDHGQLYFFDVGQGDAIYYRTAAGNDLLIDTGPGDVVLSRLGRVFRFWDHELEMVILTHPHADHISGMVELLKRYRVKTVMISQADYQSETYKTLQKLLADKAVQIVRPRLGQRVFFDESTVLDILYPLTGKFENAPTDANDISTVARLSFGTTQVLFTGDADKDIEALLLRLPVPLEAEILKVAHQGSKTSSDPKFLTAVAPEYSIISVGKNSYGHPHEEVLSALSNLKTRILRTDEKGSIAFELYPDRAVLSK